MNSDIKKIFLNKICTIILKPINRNFNEEQNINYFVGSVIDINEEGILMEHPENKVDDLYKCLEENIDSYNKKDLDIFLSRITIGCLGIPDI